MACNSYPPEEALRNRCFRVPDQPDGLLRARLHTGPHSPAISRSTRKLAAALTVLFACLTQFAYAQESEEEDSAEVIDEIVVEGEKSLGQLRHIVFRAEDNFYALFNSINDDDDFDIRCVDESPIGSRVKQRVCKANFELRAAAEEAQGVRLGIPTQTARGEVTKQKQVFLEKMEAAVAENPGLLKALAEFGDAKSEYETAKQKRCEDSFLTCSEPQ